MIPSSAKGQKKKRARRTPVPIPVAHADRLRVSAAARGTAEALFVKPCGDVWHYSGHARPFARAVAAIGEDRETVSSYALRHTHVTAQLLAGLPCSSSPGSMIHRPGKSKNIMRWHPGELYPRGGLIVTNLTRCAERVVAFYNHRKCSRISCRLLPLMRAPPAPA